MTHCDSLPNLTVVKRFARFMPTGGATTSVPPTRGVDNGPAPSVDACTRRLAWAGSPKSR